MENILGPRIRTSGVVTDRPFWAKTEATREGEGAVGLSSRGSIARDRQGRTRMEFGFGQQVFGASISDPVAQKGFLIDVVRRRFHEVEYRPLPARSAFDRPADAETRMIERVECFRAAMPPLVEEAWVSPALQHVVTERAREGGSSFTWRMFDIHLEEPPADLFKIPAGFQQVDRL
jgi:hypothetical protein